MTNIFYVHMERATAAQQSTTDRKVLSCTKPQNEILKLFFLQVSPLSHETISKVFPK